MVSDSVGQVSTCYLENLWIGYFCLSVMTHVGIPGITLHEQQPYLR